MRAFIVYNGRYPETEREAVRCYDTFDAYFGWHPELFDGCEPETLPAWEKRYRIGDARAKLKPGAPRFASKKACFYSHFALWLRAAELDEAVAVLEYDTACIADWGLDPPLYGVIHLSLQTFCGNRKNGYASRWPGEPAHLERLAARRPGLWALSETLRGRSKRDMPGNTAYCITPLSARRLVDDCRAHGWRQNDNLMTRELVPLLCLLPSPIAYLEAADHHTSHRVLS